jgi:hypothetical protein
MADLHHSALDIQQQSDIEAVLVVGSSKPPKCFIQVDPQPKKNTKWQETTDFTNGEASQCKQQIGTWASSPSKKPAILVHQSKIEQGSEHLSKLLQAARTSHLPEPSKESQVQQQATETAHS